jgi:type II secretory pathway component PulF
MAWFGYHALDANNQPLSGEIEAEGVDAAYLLLSARGLRSVRVNPTATRAPLQPVVEQSAATEPDAEVLLELVNLPADEARQLAEQLAALARAGLPLAPGLRAAAAEMPSRRLTAALNWLADQLDAGRPLDGVLAAQPRLVPEHVRRLIAAGIRSGHLAETLDELVEIDRSSRDLARGIRLAAAYPLLLLVIFVVVVSMIEVYVAPAMVQVYSDFEIGLPWQTVALTWLSGDRMLIALGIAVTSIPMLYVVMRAALPPTARRGLVAWIPLYGKAVFWRATASWSRLLALLLDRGIAAPDALRLASEGSSDANVRAAGQAAARAVTSGRPMSHSVEATHRLPASLVPLLRWGEATGTLPDALRSAAEMFETRVRMRTSLLQSALPPLMFVLIALGALLLLQSYLLPLLVIIGSLT